MGVVQVKGEDTCWKHKGGGRGTGLVAKSALQLAVVMVMSGCVVQSPLLL